MDTIAAIATSHGVGSIAVIRLSGPASLDIAKKLSHKDNFTPRYASLSLLYDSDNDLIDESLVIYFKAPHSFTAEDVVEFQCHGGIVVASLILDEVIKNGARLADPGEFSKRAFLNGRIDLTEAEAISKLIETKSIEAAKILTRQMKGEVKEFVESVRDNLVHVLAYVEVNIDYAEEDLPQNLMDQIQNKLDNLRIELKKTYESSKRREGLIDGFKVAIVGKPNVGKSSLLNSLLNYDRAIISNIAGTTRDTIEEEIKVGTHLVKIVDTAGIREANDVIEKIGIERSLSAIKEADVIIAMFDNSREFDEEDSLILKMLTQEKTDKHVLYVINKNDLECKLDISKINEKTLSLNSHISADSVVDEMKLIFDLNSQDETLLLSSKRQMEAVKDAYESIEASTELLSEGELELFAFHLNEAIMRISSISRNFERTEILDKMFGSFCLGK